MKIHQLIKNIFEDHILKTIELENSQSIKLIKGNFLNNSTFSFHGTTASHVEKELRKLYPSKIAQKRDIPIQIIADNINIFSLILCQGFNESIETGKFPSEIKSAHATPVFKTENQTKKVNYRPISISPNLSKVYREM